MFPWIGCGPDLTEPADATSPVRDETFGEDRCRIRTQHGPQQLATARNAAIALCRAHNHHDIAAARREFAWNPSRLFAIQGFLKE